MRIITGSARGLRLEAPEGLGTRPILDAQKEMLFNVLQERAAADFVIDLFAGSGGLGLEALSRGAASALFVERDREALRCLRANVGRCGFAERSRIVPVDAFRVALTDPSRRASLVFVDPPFPCFERDRERLEGLLRKLAGAAAVAPGATIVWRMPGEAREVAIPTGLVERDRRSAGRSVFLILEKMNGHPLPR
jgi:16S rRNA (guanine(966)-N(2))-methyltransferase RsmD